MTHSKRITNLIRKFRLSGILRKAPNFNKLKPQDYIFIAAFPVILWSFYNFQKKRVSYSVFLLVLAAGLLRCYVSLD
ncbi:MAG: hypothetical protein ABIQ74_08385, partial [Chitinophagales bacterium]